MSQKIEQLFQKIYDLVPLLPSVIVILIVDYIPPNMQGIYVGKYRIPSNSLHHFDFWRPSGINGIATDDTNLIISDGDDRMIKILDQKGNQLGNIPIINSVPVCINVFDKQIYVIYAGTNKIYIYDLITTQLVNLIDCPSTNRIKIYDSLIYILPGYTEPINPFGHIKSYNRVKEISVYTLRGQYVKNYKFNENIECFTIADDHIYVAYEHQIECVSLDGISKFKWTVEKLWSAPPKYLLIYNDFVYVTRSNEIQQYNMEGILMNKWTSSNCKPINEFIILNNHFYINNVDYIIVLK